PSSAAWWTARARPTSAARRTPQTWARPSRTPFEDRHSMKTYNIAAIPGDGIGTEVIAAGIQVLESLARKDGRFRMHFEHFDWGSDYYLKHGEMMPADGLDKLKPFDAIYFGAVGSKEVADHVTLWGLRLNICQNFDQYANVRPA